MSEEAGPAVRRHAAAAAVATSALLIAVKLALAGATGSVAVLAEAAHSAANLLASLVSALGVRGGSGTAGALEGVLVLAAFAAVRDLGDPVDEVSIAIAGLAACAAVAGLAAVYVGRVARAGTSRELHVDAQHLRTSAATSALVAAALGLLALTGLDVLDGLAALAIAAVVARSGVNLMRAIRPGEEGLDAFEIAAVARALADGPPAVVGYRRLRARTVGPVRRIDVDVTVRRDVSAAHAASVRAEVAAALEERLPDARIVVHVVRPSPAGRPGGRRRVP
jgi:divalent metal cation (Fe/Co/Zn/Cd) transporter